MATIPAPLISQRIGRKRVPVFADAALRVRTGRCALQERGIGNDPKCEFGSGAYRGLLLIVEKFPAPELCAACAEDPHEDRIHMLEVIAEVEAGLDLLRRQV